MLETIEIKKKIRLKMSENDFLERELANEDHSSERYEFLDGYIRDMGYATPTHELLVGNFIYFLNYFYRKLDFKIYGSNRLLYVEEYHRYFYPDLQMVEGEPIYRDYKQTMKATLNPSLLVEVISESSEEYDHVEKWNCYQAIPSLKQYVIVSQKEKKVESYRRVSDEWLYVSLHGDNAILKVLDCEITLGDLYEKVVFEK
ncbi:Uma2 family endonuclease [Emticicia sp.]|uniref:Uma2 family endonuclease n=1 Tax=Emticicia sp. TaxID=1930953 RepID=UPI0037513E86